MNCPSCTGALELGTGGTYARCTKCFSLYMSMNNTLTPYPVEDSMRTMMEQALGFAPSKPAAKPEPPTVCSMPTCGGALERVDSDDEIFTRCPRCGILSQLQGSYLIPVVVQAPGNGGWEPEFQAIFEEELGFKKRVRKMPPGVIGG